MGAVKCSIHGYRCGVSICRCLNEQLLNGNEKEIGIRRELSDISNEYYEGEVFLSKECTKEPKCTLIDGFFDEDKFGSRLIIVCNLCYPSLPVDSSSYDLADFNDLD